MACATVSRCWDGPAARAAGCLRLFFFSGTLDAADAVAAESCAGSCRGLFLSVFFGISVDSPASASAATSRVFLLLISFTCPFHGRKGKFFHRFMAASKMVGCQVAESQLKAVLWWMLKILNCSCLICWEDSVCEFVWCPACCALAICVWAMMRDRKSWRRWRLQACVCLLAMHVRKSRKVIQLLKYFVFSAHADEHAHAFLLCMSEK